jgi:predicted nucleic acid-binding protein
VPRVYLDVCCLNRPFDDQTQARIRLESEAVLIILAECEKGQWDWMSSEVVDVETERTPDPERRRRVQLVASRAHRSLTIGESEIERARQLEAWGIGSYDALHLACAERGQVDVFLTTDDSLLHKAATLGEQLDVRVENPVVWLGEVG